MAWIGSVHCEKFKHDIVVRTFALIAPVWLVLQQVLCNSETVANAPKWKETHQTLSLGSNGVDREHSLQKILTKHRGTNCCINCTSLSHFASVSCSSETVPNGPKREETHQNMCLGSNGVDQECSLCKILKRHHGMNFCIYCNSLSSFASSLGSNGVDRGCSFRKILTRHRDTNFCINCTCLARFAAIFVQ